MASTLSALQPPGLPDEISCEELYRRLDGASLVVVDVLPKEAYNEGHIPGAINLPLAELAAHAGGASQPHYRDRCLYASFT